MHNKCIGSELDLTDVFEDNLVDLGEMRKINWCVIGVVGVESVKSPSDHYFSRVLVEQEILVNAASCERYRAIVISVGLSAHKFQRNSYIWYNLVFIVLICLNIFILISPS